MNRRSFLARHCSLLIFLPLMTGSAVTLALASVLPGVPMGFMIGSLSTTIAAVVACEGRRRNAA